MNISKLAIISHNLSDARVLGDLFRVYFPGIVPEHLFLNGMAQERGWPVRLEIEEDSGDRSFSVRLCCFDKSYRGQSRDSGAFLGEQAHHRRRRLLRLSVHEALSAYLADNGRMLSPWGILTGVRPVKIVHRLRGYGLTDAQVLKALVSEYALQPAKAELLVKVAARQVPHLAAIDRRHKISLYIAIPFCPSRCHYCSFPAFAIDRWGHLLEPYLESLAEEIKAVAEALRYYQIGVQTIYIGGGTPTVLQAEQLALLLRLVQREIPLVSGQELTVEAGRPDTLEHNKLQVLREYGINRISINPQTFCDQTLRAIGRNHRAADIIAAYALARDVGFPVINMDLILGLPNENKEILASTLSQILELRPENITLHALAIKRAAFFNEMGVRLPAADEGAEMAALAQQALETAGYEAYYLYRQKQIAGYGENIGYCLPGTASLYNILMMEEQQTILGLGVGAGSKIIRLSDNSIENFYNPKDIILYRERLPGIIAQKVDKVRYFR